MLSLEQFYVWWSFGNFLTMHVNENKACWKRTLLLVFGENFCSYKPLRQVRMILLDRRRMSSIWILNPNPNCEPWTLQVVIRGWLAAFARVSCQKFVGKVTECGGRELSNDDHQRWCSKVGWRTKSKDCPKQKVNYYSLLHDNPTRKMLSISSLLNCVLVLDKVQKFQLST